MPYIEDLKLRALYDSYLRNIVSVFNKVPKYKQYGHLNYIITRLLLNTEPVNYKDFNAIIGVLESVKLEFYRRKVSLYEDIKIKENGDVY